MSGDTLAAMKHLDGARGITGPHLLTDEREWYRVVMLVDLDVVIEAGTALLPLGVAILHSRKRLESSPLDLFKQRTPTCSEVSRHTLVDLIYTLADGGVEFSD